MHFWLWELGRFPTIFGKIKMADTLMTVFGVGINTLAFVGTSYVFSKSSRGDAKAEYKWHDLAEENIMQGINGMNREWASLILSITSFDKEMRQKHISAMLTKQWLSNITYFQKRIKLLPPEPQLSDFYHPSQVQKNGELLLVTVGTGLATYAL